jgi:hypothetical protein
MNRRSKIFSRSVLMAALLRAISPAWSADGQPQAQEYIFNVPVSLQQLDPKIVRGTVSCEIGAVVDDRQPGEKGASARYEKFDAASAPFDIKNGQFRGTAPVHIVVTKTTKPGSATYSCTLHLRLTDGQEALSCFVTNIGASHESKTTCKPQTWTNIDDKTLVANATGKLPAAPASRR